MKEVLVSEEKIISILKELEAEPKEHDQVLEWVGGSFEDDRQRRATRRCTNYRPVPPPL